MRTTFHELEASVQNFRIAPDGRWLVAKQHDGAIVWDLTSDRVAARLTETNDDFNMICFSQDSSTLAAHHGNDLLVWKTAAFAGK